jgi:hypothetical protein
MDKFWYVHIMANYTAAKMNETESLLSMTLKLRNISNKKASWRMIEAV